MEDINIHPCALFQFLLYEKEKREDLFPCIIFETMCQSHFESRNCSFHFRSV